MIYFNGKEITPKLNGVNLSRVMYNGKQVWPKLNNVVEIQLADTVAGDICVWDGSKKRFFRFVDSSATDDIRNYMPIGVVVVPASHNVYGDGSCGVMSLKAMNCDTPSTGGTSEQSMYWGEYGTDISTLPNLDQVPIVGSGSNVGNASSTVTGEGYYAYLPSDKFSAVQCPHDTDAYYYGSYDQAPSSYLTDGSRNPAYYQTSSPSSSSNALADFDGIGNTEKIITQRGTKDYNSWTPGRTTEADYPAASCCDMFHTEGTQQGDWYLPACGELGYTMPPFNKINDAIGKIHTAYGSSVGVELDTNNRYWSSTESSSHDARRVFTDDGYVGGYSKYSSSYVRAFLKVSPLDVSGISSESASNGVYIYANNGKLYNPNEWDTANNDLAVGVAVVTDNCRFAITKGEKPQRAWSAALYRTDVSGLNNYVSGDSAASDFNGENNTAIIREAASGEDASNNAAHYCYNQTISINGRGTVHGYLPALGELAAAYNNKSSVDNVMSLIGGTAMPTDYRLWSSTESSTSSAWALYWDSDIKGSYIKRNASHYAVPMYSLD